MSMFINCIKPARDWLKLSLGVFAVVSEFGSQLSDLRFVFVAKGCIKGYHGS